MDKKIIAILILAVSIVLHGIITKPQYTRYEVITTSEYSVLIIDHEEDKIYKYNHTNYIGENEIQLVEML